MNGTDGLDIVCFDRDGKVVRTYVRLTREKRVWKADLRRLISRGLRVPLRYSEGGIHHVNPDAGWPAECILPGDPPEVYAWMGQAFVDDLHSTLLLHHPNKMTQAEKDELAAIDRRLLGGAEWPEDEARRTALLAEIGQRDISLDKW